MLKVTVAEYSGDLPSRGLIYSSIYHSPVVFFKDYAEMERKFKVYIYPDGDPNTYFQTPRKLTGKYSSEGYFFQNIRESRFRTADPDQADLFFVPISCHKMRGKVSMIVLRVWCYILFNYKQHILSFTFSPFFFNGNQGLLCNIRAYIFWFIWKFMVLRIYFSDKNVVHKTNNCNFNFASYEDLAYSESMNTKQEKIIK